MNGDNRVLFLGIVLVNISLAACFFPEDTFVRMISYLLGTTKDLYLNNPILFLVLIINVCLFAFFAKKLNKRLVRIKRQVS